jgi:hypothetical protein
VYTVTCDGLSLSPLLTSATENLPMMLAILNVVDDSQPQRTRASDALRAYTPL